MRKYWDSVLDIVLNDESGAQQGIFHEYISLKEVFLGVQMNINTKDINVYAYTLEIILETP